MGWIEEKKSGRRRRLAPRVLVGRSRQADLCLPGSWVSGEHAVIAWDGLEWKIRDLGSRNGTTLDGRPLESRTDRSMKRGAVMAFGQAEEQWLLADASGPIPMGLEGDRCVLAIDRVLTLPDDESPSVTVYREGDRWLAEQGEVEREVTDRDALVVDGAIWSLRLPEAREITQAHISSRRLADFRLELAVSRDEEVVQVRLLCDSHRIILEPRSHHYMLVILARHALDQRGDGHSTGEAGWLDPEELSRLLRLGRQSINVYIHRIRGQVADVGIFDGKGIIERQPGTFALRIAPIEIELVAL